MARSRRGKKRVAREYSPEALMFRTVSGIVLIALGVLALLSLVAGLRGSAFDMVRGITKGLGGSLCFGVAVFLIWGGVLLCFSARKSMPMRGIALLFVFYLSVLSIINLLSKVAEVSFLDFVINRNRLQHPPMADPEGLLSVLATTFGLCDQSGMFGGALGVPLAWALHTYVGQTAGVVVLVVVCLLCAMFFSKFDLIGWAREAKGRSDEKLAEREAEKQRQTYEEMQRQMEQEAEKSQPAYVRRGKKSKQFSTDPQENPVAFGMPGAGSLPGGMPAMFPVNMPMSQGGQAMGFPPTFPAQPAQTVQLYDELILPRSEEKPAWRMGGKKKGKSAEEAVPAAIQTEMTFTPSEVGSRDLVDRASKKAAERLEEIRRRKAELAQQLYQNQTAGTTVSGVAAPTEPIHAQAFVTGVRRGPEPDKTESDKRPGPTTANTTSQTPMSGQRLDKPALKLPATQKAARAEEARNLPPPYVYPTLDLLSQKQHQAADTRAQDAENAARLEKTLESFGIPARVQRVTHGPAVTRFELGLVSSGINVKRIMSIADNIALEMAANGGVRIEIPIPGTNLFGIEIPNREITPVSLAEVLVSPEMSAAKSPLAVALGRDIAGKPIICDLAKMPHLLIAGQTGSGKSVCINTIVNSILFRSSPEEVRMIMIDPKVVELQCYNVVPHLLIPVVSDPHKAAGALAWAVAEMLDRYHKMQSKNVRELNAYNAKLGPDEPKLPRIVIIIDELADLMLACKKEVEESIIRIAQLARAAGIHMIVATQRPTVDVITGLIKANVPSRIAFAVSSSIDSRTILDMNGAEKLLGRGDMFYFPTGAGTPLRVQGCFMSDGEIENVVDDIGQHTHVEFDPNIIEAMESENEPVTGLDDMGDGGVDDKLQEAIEMVIADGQASISMLQRRMKIGYARAGRLIDDMAARGVVSKSAGSKPREVLMTREEFERIKDSILK